MGGGPSDGGTLKPAPDTGARPGTRDGGGGGRLSEGGPGERLGGGGGIVARPRVDITSERGGAADPTVRQEAGEAARSAGGAGGRRPCTEEGGSNSEGLECPSRGGGSVERSGTGPVDGAESSWASCATREAVRPSVCPGGVDRTLPFGKPRACSRVAGSPLITTTGTPPPDRTSSRRVLSEDFPVNHSRRQGRTVATVRGTWPRAVGVAWTPSRAKAKSRSARPRSSQTTTICGLVRPVLPATSTRGAPVLPRVRSKVLPRSAREQGACTLPSQRRLCCSLFPVESMFDG